MFIQLSFIIAKWWKPLKCLSTDEWVTKCIFNILITGKNHITEKFSTLTSFFAKINLSFGKRFYNDKYIPTTTTPTPKTVIWSLSIFFKILGTCQLIFSFYKYIYF